jgi:hypothetical protein
MHNLIFKHKLFPWVLYFSKLLTIYPENNCMALVYRDQESLKFTKYINHTLNAEMPTESLLYEIYLVYYE